MSSIDEVIAHMDAIDKKTAVFMPLVDHFLELRFQLKMNNVQDFKLYLKRDDWPDQYKAGIDRVLGMEIIWA